MKRNKIKFVFFTFFLFCCSGLFAQEKDGGQKTIYTESQQKLRITRADIRIIHEKNPELGGFHLYVRKIDGVESILLTETAKDPEGKQDSYAYRAKEYNSINGDEIRLLDGKVLVSEGAKYSLVDSSVEETSFFGPAFHIYIPPVIVYGYEWSRNGEVEIGEGTFVNIRSFEKPYADYSGNFMDSPFMFNFVVKKKPEEAKLTDQYNPLASDAFKEISGDIIYSKGPESLIDDISDVFDKLGNTDDMDLIFVIDATGSMKDDMERLKSDLVPLVEKKLGEYPLARIGLLFYRDYGDTFKFMNLPVRFFDFTSDLKIFQKNLNSVKIMGKEGGDVPEAVYEAIFAASDFYKWGNESNRQIILIGDAQPHPLPRGSGKYSKEFVMEKAAEKNVKIHSILLPSD